MRYDMVAGDLEPLELTLDGVGSIAGATVTFVMAQADGPTRIAGSAVIDDPVKRVVHYQWAQGDTDVPGVYRAQMQAVYSGGVPETFPSDEPLYVVIHPRL